MELKAKLIVKIFVLPDMDEITLSPFIMEGTVINNFPELTGAEFFKKFGLDHLCIAVLSIFQDFLALIASNSESSDGSATLLPLIEMIAMFAYIINETI